MSDDNKKTGQTELGRPWRQDETENLQKSENPNSGYMKDRQLCGLCHGAARNCGMVNCPQRPLVA